MTIVVRPLTTRLAQFAVLRFFSAASLAVLLYAAIPGSVLAADAPLSPEDVADAVTGYAVQNQFPNKLVFHKGSKNAFAGHVRYTFDPGIHANMADVYLRYQPDYACFVAIDPDSGAILNLTSFVKQQEDWDNLVMRSDYPAASVFKVITAAAGLDLNKVSPSTVIPYNGKSTSLYKRQVFNHKNNKWTRTPTLKESFAKSVNPVFGQLGVFHLGQEQLVSYAQRFGFDQILESDFHLPPSQIKLSFDNDWELAEAASGFTRDITLSPIHAAQIAATIANEGKLVTPYMVDRVYDGSGSVIYHAGQRPADDRQVVDPATARQLMKLMQATTAIGSARKSFRGLNRYQVYKDMKIGGKTGSLTGFSPKGRHDWFVGYAEKNGKRVAFASLIINKEKWYVRSAYVARQFIYHYFNELDEQQREDLAAANALQ